MAGNNGLETPWTFYFERKDNMHAANAVNRLDANAYRSSVRTLGSFDSVEGFWNYYSYMVAADALPLGIDVFMFRTHCGVPAWESFPQGGCWIVKVHKRNGVIARLWEELLFALIAEQFGDPTVVGAVLSSRSREDLLSIWISDTGAQFRIGKKLKQVLNLDDGTCVEYKKFSSSMLDGSSFRNAKPV